MRNKYSGKTLIGEIIVCILALLFILPLFFVVTTALKPKDEIFTGVMTMPTHPEWSNFDTVWKAGVGDSFLNSLIITLCSVVLLVMIGSMCAYVLARRTGPLSSGLYIMFVVGIIMPFQLSIVPLYVAFQKAGLAGTMLGMIVLWVGVFMPLTITLYTSFIRQLPKDYEEAARIDGARAMRIFYRVIFPLLRPVTGTVAIITGLFIWNDFFASVIFLGGSSSQTLPVAVYSFVGQYISKWNLVFAAILVAILPFIVFFILTQKQMIRGFAGGMKG